jgi:cytochrome c
MRVSAILLIAWLPLVVHAQDIATGEQVFRTNCSICHTTYPGRNYTGPSLFGVVNRQSGDAPNYQYSAAMQKAHLTWTPETLDRWLTSPRQLVPGTRMTFPGLKDPKLRADLISYLATRH